VIQKMSKVEIAGPKRLLEPVTSVVREAGVFHLEKGLPGLRHPETGTPGLPHIETSPALDLMKYVRPLCPDEKSLKEKFFLENLRLKIEELFSYLPVIEVRKSYIEPESVLREVPAVIEKHLTYTLKLSEKKIALTKEIDELKRYSPFLDSLTFILKDIKESPDLDFIGLTIKYPEALASLRELITRITRGRSEIITSLAPDGTLVGLIITGKRESEKVKSSLSEENIPELSFPSSLKELSFPQKVSYLRERLGTLSLELDSVNGKLREFAARWKPMYIEVRNYIDEKLSVLFTAACAFQTGMCFFLYGWIPQEDVKELRKNLEAEFGGSVLLEEKEISEEEMEKVPIVLKNPAYFKPFEILTRFMPLPRYTSYDPTPFLAIFFPVFFGIILGDIGYGLILLFSSVLILKKRSSKKELKDVGIILLLSSFYAVLFGALYGEFFGDLGKKMFGIEPNIDRQKAVIPMLIFAVSVGIIHITLGLVLGFLSAFRKKEKKESFYKLLNAIFIIALTAFAASHAGVLPIVTKRYLLIAILALLPLLLFTGGFLAPLELLKSLGNIISYARIMAIGLTSVLLAFVANRLAGLAGDLFLGIIVGALLHAINLLLGVFSPTIHSIRLHYVEFFGKFIESGGRRFEPLKRKTF
jgi:V/A-type H+-transporting ATPase subunit I